MTMTVAVKEPPREARKSNADAANQPARPMIRTNGIILAANIAHDPQGRLSAHGIFTGVQTDGGTFEFPSPIYVVVNLLGLTSGAHKVGASQTGPWTTESEVADILADEHGQAMVAIPMHSVVTGYGLFSLGLTIDGEKVDTGFTLNVKPMEEGESGS